MNVGGTLNTVVRSTLPSLMAAAMLNTFATDPGSFASTAAMLPESAEYVPSSFKRSVDIA